MDKGWFYLFVTLLNRIYWISGATIGGLMGNLIKFNTKGLDFAMTALFVVILVEQFLKEKYHLSTLIGMITSIACLLIFGGDNFMIPTMICILVLLTAFRKPIESKGLKKNDDTFTAGNNYSNVRAWNCHNKISALYNFQRKTSYSKIYSVSWKSTSRSNIQHACNLLS